MTERLMQTKAESDAFLQENSVRLYMSNCCPPPLKHYTTYTYNVYFTHLLALCGKIAYHRVFLYFKYKESI